jgi:2-polyprenyl-6-methoxyphenol hydroxylase-like FAD-dependent oxidoreductase
MKNQPFDFIIVGSGLSGIICGIELAQLNKKCLILERSHHLTRPLCGEYLTPKGREILIHLGLSHTLTGFDALYGMEIVSPSGIRIKTHFPENQIGLSLNRKVHQERLHQHFLQLGGSILKEIEIEDITFLSDQVRVKTNQGFFTSLWLIGADGRQSQVAKLAGLKTLPSPHKKVALHCYLKPKHALERFGQMYILPGGDYIGINPINDNEVNFSMITTSEAIKKAGGIKNLINFWINQQNHLKEQFHNLKNEEIKSISPITRRTERITGQRIALIGDASGFIDPLTGEGMTTALQTAKLLVDEIKFHSNTQLALIQYEIKRKSEFYQKEKFNLILQSIIRINFLCEIIAIILESSDKLKSLFIGIIGNIYSPQIAVKKLFSKN